MKTLLDGLIQNDTELAHYACAARIAVTGEPDLSAHFLWSHRRFKFFLVK
jgi:hypothetical protein